MEYLPPNPPEPEELPATAMVVIEPDSLYAYLNAVDKTGLPYDFVVDRRDGFHTDLALRTDGSENGASIVLYANGTWKLFAEVPV